ncbi:MAG: transcription-repair coupling factor [Sphaerochaetaceae bacterium]
MKKLLNYLTSSSLYKDFLKNPRSNFRAMKLENLSLCGMLKLFYLSKKIDGLIFAICPTEESAKSLYNDSKIFFDENVTIFLPTSGRVLYSDQNGNSNEFERIEALSQILKADSGVVFTSLRAFITKLPAPDSVKTLTLTLRVGDDFDSTRISNRLVLGKYYRTNYTSMEKDFSVKGEVLDIFPPSSKYPVRVYSAWDQIEKIVYYDGLTQKTIKTLGHIDIPLALSKEEENADSFIDSYLTGKEFFCFDGDVRLKNSFKALNNEAKALYRKNWTSDRQIERPSEVLMDFNKFFEESDKSLKILDLDDKKGAIYSFDVDGPRSYFGNFTLFKADLEGLFNNGWDVSIFSSSKVQGDRIKQLLLDFDKIRYFVGTVSEGFSLSRDRFLVLNDNEIFGRRKQLIKTLSNVVSSPLDSFVDLNEGDFVVHINYGIGKFVKIDRLRQRDYIKIQYADDETLYVPIEQANLVQRYIGSAGNAPRLDRLGSKGWEKKKAKAKHNAENLAKSLIELYARRKNSIGFTYLPDNDWQLSFEALFPYEETEDQLRCIDEIKMDMESSKVMDRLVCGDVGFGKTEVAFRAAFKAVMGGKQVAFLAPTTILSEQHYNNFLNRIERFPIKAACLSRLVSKKDQKEILSDLKKGKIDVLFGTHRIIQKDICFNNLGLLVVDEEQRFGVKDKERIKSLKANIDCLSLSATPIPRTLYMSLLKIRDMSILSSAPVARQAIQTEIEEFNMDTIVNAIRKETDRGGQVFYLHNRIETLEEVVSLLSSKLPDLVIERAHGQMSPDYLEDTMRRFIHEGIHVLVATTIIENGIDIPNVNTIIIDRADRYGTSQLYQLRGRVGRSDVQSYAYLLYPKGKVLSEIALKRLKIIGDNTSLGSGFKVAMKDLELRGAGNLIGREQSGQLSSVGLDMYIRLLDEAISDLQANEKEKPKKDVLFELDYSGFIPDSYISEPSSKFEIYKKIAGITQSYELDSLISEIENRFGTIPEEVLNLLYIAELKILCRKLDIYHLKERQGKVIVEFSKIASLSIDKLIELVRTSNGSVKLDPNRPTYLEMVTNAISLKDKSLFILEKLQRIAP